MIDAIFIQSFDKEVRNYNLQRLLNSLSTYLNDKDIEIFIFLNFQAEEFEYKIKFPANLKINIIYVDEDGATNPTSKIFHFLINYQADKYKKILLLESDCALKENFDLHINFDLNQLETSSWFIYGSTYYGIMPWMSSNEDEDSRLRRKHINGVAVYNRTQNFLRIMNLIFLSNNLEEDVTNYDFALHLHYKKFNIKNELIDSKLILNISDPNYDTELTHHDIKPEAVIVHTKNDLYF